MFEWFFDWHAEFLSNYPNESERLTSDGVESSWSALVSHFVPSFASYSYMRDMPWEKELKMRRNHKVRRRIDAVVSNAMMQRERRNKRNWSRRAHDLRMTLFDFNCRKMKENRGRRFSGHTDKTWEDWSLENCVERSAETRTHISRSFRHYSYMEQHVDTTWKWRKTIPSV